MAKILIIEDDLALNKGIALVMTKEGHETTSKTTYQEGLQAFHDNTYDLILLDIQLQEGNGVELLKEIRTQSNIPAIFITGQDTEEEMIEGFQAGCDDYIPKPFSLVLLIQRVQALLRRSLNQTKRHCYTYKNLTVDYDKRTVTKEEHIALSKNEYDLLYILTKNQGQVLTRQLLLEKLWDVNGTFVDDNALSVNIRRLRKKIEDDPKNPEFIHTVFGVGYTWGE